MYNLAWTPARDAGTAKEDVAGPGCLPALFVRSLAIEIDRSSTVQSERWEFRSTSTPSRVFWNESHGEKMALTHTRIFGKRASRFAKWIEDKRLR
jgi:hypothetical protein